MSMCPAGPRLSPQTGCLVALSPSAADGAVRLLERIPSLAVAPEITTKLSSDSFRCAPSIYPVLLAGSSCTSSKSVYIWRGVSMLSLLPDLPLTQTHLS